MPPFGEEHVARNPLNYLENERVRRHTNASSLKWRLIRRTALALGLGVQIFLYFTLETPAAAELRKKKQAQVEAEKARAQVSRGALQSLDAAPGSGIMEVKREVKIVKGKPGDAHVKLDEEGNEMVETGTSTIPFFPRTIRVRSADAAPSSQAVSTTPGKAVDEGMEEYQLLGLGIRTVSFLSIQVYVLGMYVRTSDLDRLQAAFVKLVNPLGSSLIPSEKDTLRRDLMSTDESLAIWNRVLLETGVRSAVRIVPTRGTDFAHLRDGWVRGITARTQELSRKAEGKSEFDEPGFGESMAAFKQMMGGKGSAPKGSVLLLTRDENGALGLILEGNKGSKDGLSLQGSGEVLGRVQDERISRQVWLGYLGGKGVSSEGARKSIVDGVLELVERPVGTLGTQVS